MPKLRTYPNVATATRNLTQTKRAVARLRQARDHLTEAGAKRAAARVRLALKSAEGAVRHAEGMMYWHATGGLELDKAGRG